MEITQPKHWDFSKFKEVLLTLGTLGKGTSIPSVNCPKSIHLQGLRDTIDTLTSNTRKKGIEYAQTVLVDIERKSLVVGKITHGTATETVLNKSLQPGRERQQKMVGSIHTHPMNQGPEYSHGLSGQDYITFLSDPDQQFMMIAWGDDYRIMVLKTSVSPNNQNSNRIRDRIKDCEKDFLISSEGGAFARVARFNKEACAEFGLILYLADSKSRDLFERVMVV
ncbi:MAG: hypothetical protein Q8L51_01635 [Candidatus Amesbacteria bacterium]|nr:hypothetical protein [Candidatus Amesbacteria bacterium]